MLYLSSGGSGQVGSFVFLAVRLLGRVAGLVSESGGVFLSRVRALRS